MSGFAVKRQYIGKPSGLVEIDWSASISIGLKHAIDIKAGLDAVTKRILGINKDQTMPTVDGSGRVLQLSDSVANTVDRVYLTDPWHPGESDFTVAILLSFLREGTNNDTSVCGVRPVLPGSTTSEWSLTGNYAATSNDYKPGFVVVSGATNYLAAASKKREIGRPTLLVGVKDRLSGKLYMNGELVGQNNSFPASVNVTSNRLEIGKLGGSSTGYYNLYANVQLFAMWSRVLSGKDVASLTALPWQMFRQP